MSKVNESYASFEIVLPVPNSTTKHRCQVARDIVADELGQRLAELWTIQKAKEVRGNGVYTYYEFGGNIPMDEL